MKSVSARLTISQRVGSLSSAGGRKYSSEAKTFASEPLSLTNDNQFLLAGISQNILFLKSIT